MRRIAWGLAGASVALTAVALALAYLDRSLQPGRSSLTLAGVSQLLVAVGAAVIGALIASRHPGNRIGWLALAGGVTLLLSECCKDYGVRALIAAPGSLPAGHLVMWLYWVTGFLPWTILGITLLLFPDGRLPSPRWRPVAWLLAAIFAWGDVQAIVGATLAWSHPFVSLYQVYLPGPFAGILFALPAALAVCALAVVIRFFRSSGEERLQLTWFAAATTVLGGALVPRILTDSTASIIVMDLALICLEVTIAVAVLRYRLYDIDIVISRALLYAGLAAFITVVYVVLVAGVGAAAGARSSTWLSAVAAAVVAVAFQPVRARAARLANRVVYGRRATPYQVLSDFAGRIGGAYSIEDVLPDLARVVAAGTGARRVVVWLTVGHELRAAVSTDPAVPATALPALPRPAAAVVPAGGRSAEAVSAEAVSAEAGSAATGTADEESTGASGLDGLPGADVVVPVTRDGRLLGAIGITMPRGEPLQPAGRQLVADVATQAGLALANVGLVEDLRASRQRLVTAQDEARRRLERNLHDGAQQDLVSLVIKAGLAAEHSAGLPEACQALHELRRDATAALENLRDLARGVYPPRLADLGLAAALSAQASRSALPVTVDAAVLGRFPEETEAAVYFCCIEALANIAKYAAATRAVITLRAVAGALTFNVTDDGAGFDAALTPLGAGLRNMSDRLSALGGRLEVTSAPGAGTTITGRLPVPAMPPEPHTRSLSGVTAV
jgi:signal transduction histidine kinase